jgi:hypothetical protein
MRPTGPESAPGQEILNFEREETERTENPLLSLLPPVQFFYAAIGKKVTCNKELVDQ